MNKEIKDLIEISQYYGKQKKAVIAGGGNTSFKNDKFLWIKGSGHSLATIGEEGFVKMDRSSLDKIGTTEYSKEVMKRESEIKEALLNSRIEPEKEQRPSVETSFHNLMNFKYVVHTHATKVNGLMCSNQAEEKTAELFPDALYIGYEDPGYTLFKCVENKVLEYREKQGKEPSVLFLQNHGIIVGGDSVAEIKNIYDGIFSRLDKIYGKKTLCESIPVSKESDKIIPAIRMMVSGDSLKTVRLFNNTTVNFFLDKISYKKIAEPFSPDGIVYAGYKSIFMSFDGDIDNFLKEFEKEIETFEKKIGKLPKVIFAGNLGVIAIGENAGDADILEDIVTDSCKIAALAEKFGGSHPMTSAQIKFVANWEVEQYRSKIALGESSGRVDRKIFIVTGGAQGFGGGIVAFLMNYGANVVIADVNEPKGREYADELNKVDRKNKAFFVKADVSNAESVENLIYQTTVHFGGLDVFISNAGIVRAGSLEVMTPENFDLVTKINYQAYFICSKYASAVMKLQHKYNPDYFMDIIQVNSKSGLKGSNKNFAYAGGKFGGIGLTQSFALELMPFRIKVNSICPGNFFDGPLWSDPDRGLFVQYLKAGKVSGAKTVADVKKFYEDQVPAGRGCTPKDVMRAVFYAIEQEYETGQAIPVTGGQIMLN